MKECCVNHTERKAMSFCHKCKQFFCEECLVAGDEYYYCRRDDCQAEMVKLRDALPPDSELDGGDILPLVTVAAFSQPYQAELAKAHLESEGIQAFLSDEYVVGINWFLSNAVGGVTLQVAEPDAVAAREILSTDQSDASDTAVSDDASESL